MAEGGNTRGVWTGLVVVAALALVFVILWILRGGELEAAQARLASARAEANASIGTLENDLRLARTSSEKAARQAAELASLLEEERRRAAEMVRDGENRMRAAMTEVEGRLRETTLRVNEVRAELSRSAAEAETLRGELAEARAREERLAAELDAAKAAEAGAHAQLLEREASLAEAEKEVERARSLAASRARQESTVQQRLQEELAEARSALREARAELEGARTLSASRATEEAAALKRLEAELADARQALAEARAEVERARSLTASRHSGTTASEEGLEAELADAQDALSAAEQENERLGRVLTEARRLAASREEALREEIDSLRSRVVDSPAASVVETLEKEVAALREAAASNERQVEELGRTAAGLRREVERRGSQIADRDALVAVLRKQIEETAQASEASVAEAGSRERELEQSLRAEFAVERKALLDRLSILHGRLESLQAQLEELREQRSRREEAGAACADAGEGPSAGFRYTDAPDRSLGRILESLGDGRTFLIPGGWTRHMHPGLRLEVHRPEGRGYRYIGMVQVVRSMDDVSVVETVDVPPRAALCPVTGRAVLEPGAVYTPYAVHADGKGIPLAPMPEGRERDLPQVGDYVDNPFFSPDSRRLFAVDHATAGNAYVLRLIALLGGVPCLGDETSAADYVVTTGAVARPAMPGAPRPVGVDFLEAYADATAGRGGRKGR